ncbi:MAG: peptidase [Bacteroidales bacterium]|nr:MAG: peptidase [Bacteroidales bacterium]
MKKLLILAMVLLYSTLGISQIDYSDWFLPKALRIDYFLTGDSQRQGIFLDGLSEEPYWSGYSNTLIDPFSYGSYKVDVKDKETGKLLYSRGFCTLFQEWQTTDEAKVTPKAFEQVTRIPFPKKPVAVEFEGRQKNGVFASLYRFEIDPSSIYISREQGNKYPVTPIVNNGKPEQMLDITFIAEGYTLTQMESFRGDVKRLYDYLVSQEPFSKYKGKINIWAVESPSEQAGPDNPGKSIWNKTPVGTTFYTFGTDRYLTTLKFKSVMDVAANAPGDIVYILVNSTDYGGGGVYNHYNVSTANHRLSDKVFIHEFGHGLAGLGDEYYSSDVAYSDFYPKDVEPWEPNLTTLVNFESKWKGMLEPNTPIPTPVNDASKGRIGVFEGGGYVSKGVYRPAYDCRMKSNEAKGFCPVCVKAIEDVLIFYTKSLLTEKKI